MIRTFNLEETLFYLKKLYKKIFEDKKKLSFDYKLSNDTDLDYCSSIKMKKKENMTPENCFKIQLSQIPGISINLANIISLHYPSFYKLLDNYNKCDTTEEKEIMLKDIEYDIANNKKRKIGKVISKRICEYLFYENKLLTE